MNEDDYYRALKQAQEKIVQLEYQIATSETFLKNERGIRMALEMKVALREEVEAQDDTDTIEDCNDWGTGEGRFHGRM